MKFDNHRVIVKGFIRDFDALQKEDEPILPRAILEGRVISNFCLGDRVIQIESIAISR